MSVAQKLRSAREIQPGRPTQAQVAAILGIKTYNLKKYELGKVTGRKTIEPILRKLSKEWDIPETWWYDGRKTDPYEGGLPFSWAVQKPIRVYHAVSPGSPAFGMESSHMGKIDSDVAALNPIAMEIPDNRMGSRIPAGWTIYGVAGRRVLIGKPYLAIHKIKKIVIEGEELPELVAGVYVARDGGFYLEPPGEPSRRENCLDLGEPHLVVARSWPLDGEGNWTIVEKQLREGLPMTALPVSLTGSPP